MSSHSTPRGGRKTGLERGAEIEPTLHIKLFKFICFSYCSSKNHDVLGCSQYSSAKSELKLTKVDSRTTSTFYTGLSNSAIRAFNYAQFKCIPRDPDTIQQIKKANPCVIMGSCYNCHINWHTTGIYYHKRNLKKNLWQAGGECFPHF